MSVNPVIPKKVIIAKFGDIRINIQTAIGHMENMPNRDTRRLGKLYRSLQNLLRAESAINDGYPTIRTNTPIKGEPSEAQH